MTTDPMTGTLTITMRSDWHIGSGTGRPGSIDRLVQRDAHNLPYIPAKSLTGIWRDGCELVAQGLDGGQAGTWQQWVNWLFGEQQPSQNETRTLETVPRIAMLAVRSAHFPKVLQDAFRGKVLLQTMTTFVKPGVKINPHTGSALADCLRFEEMARGGIQLTAHYSLRLEGLAPEQQKIARALLVAGASMVDRLGAKRRRGAGRCQIQVTALGNLGEAIAVLKKTKGTAPAIPVLPTNPPPDGTLALNAQTESGWWCIELEAITQSPIIVHKRTVGNHQETQDYIPGTYFLPMMLKLLSQQFNMDLGNALIHGDVVITHANPVVAGIRGQAAPFAIFEPKAKTEIAKIYQRIGEAIAATTGAEKQLKGMRRGYVHLESNAEQKMLHRVNIDPEIAAHNTIVDAKQRPDAEVGGIYTYEAIPAGQTFRLEVRIRDYLVPKNAVNPFARWLQNETSVQIGRTKKDDYGHVKLKQVASGKIVDVPSSQSPTLTVWLLSDLLLRDERLRPTTDPQILADQLGTALGGQLVLLEPAENGLPLIKNLAAFARSHRTESWQTQWGLPRPSLVGLSAGTVLQFQITKPIDPVKLHALKIAGMGERTAEGYGQLGFNPELLTCPEIVPAKKSKTPPTPVSILLPDTAPKSERDYAQLIERETWREMIRKAAGAIAANPTQVESLKALSLNTSNLTRSKLGTLRSLIDSLRDFEHGKQIVQVLEHMEKKDKWRGPTLTCVKELVQNSEKIWQCYQEMGCNFADHRLTTRAETKLKQELWADAVRLLVDACIRSHQRASEQQSISKEVAHG